MGGGHAIMWLTAKFRVPATAESWSAIDPAVTGSAQLVCSFQTQKPYQEKCPTLDQLPQKNYSIRSVYHIKLYNIVRNQLAHCLLDWSCQKRIGR